MIDAELTLICTDNGKKVQAHVLSFKEKKFLEVAVNTLKLRMIYNNGTYVGNMGGYEFTIKESSLPLTSKKDNNFKRW